jgi:ribosomal protein L25 (general stress protein Ctc)
MKTKKECDTVKTFRKIKDKISADLFGKSAEEIKVYLKKKQFEV